MEYTYIIFPTHDALAFSATDTEHTQEDVPQVETKLVAHVVNEICLAASLLIETLLYAVDADALFFVVAAHADADGDRIDGDVHHDE
jgi:hypothetical protein